MIAELLFKSQPPPQLREDLPIGPRFAGGLAEGGAVAHPPLGVGHHPRLFTPLGCRQKQVGHGGGLGAGIGLVEHHQRAAAGGGLHPIQRRQAHQRIGGRHPPKGQFAPFYRFYLLPGAQSLPGGDRTGWELPVALHLRPVFGNAHLAITRQQFGQAAGLPAAHGIGLAGERKGTGPGPADLPSHQVQIHDAAHRGAAFSALVHPHRPERQHGGALGPEGRQPLNIRLLQTAKLGYPIGRPGCPELGKGWIAVGAALHVGLVDGALGDQLLADAMEQGQVGAGGNLEV